MKFETLWTKILRSIKSMVNRLQSFKNSANDCLLLKYFFTLSKNAMSRWSDILADAGGIGSGRFGIRVGSISFALSSPLVCANFVRLFTFPGWLMLARLDSVTICGAVPGALLRDLFFVPSALVVLGGGKVPTTGSLTSERIGCGVCATEAIASAALSSAALAAALACAADSGKNCLKSSRRSVASLNRVVTCAYTS